MVDVFNQLGMGTAHYQFDGGGTLVVDGPVSRPTGVVAVVGGMGAFSGATGELTGVAIGTNSTGYPNLRIIFRLMSPRRLCRPTRGTVAELVQAPSLQQPSVHFSSGRKRHSVH